MRNHMPTRFVSLEESKERGWTHFYTGETCRWGHRAPRYVTNPRRCVDCDRKHEGQLPIGLAGVPEYDIELKKPAYAQRKPELNLAPVPDVLDRLFLIKYAETKSFADAAKALGKSEFEFVGRLSWNKTFRDAVHTLEADLGLFRTVPITEDFEWTEDKRTTLLRFYVDTGNLLLAMKVIGVGNHHFTKEVDENADFRDKLEHAELLANRQLDREAIDRSLKGDSKLLQRLLAGTMPEKWGEKVQMDLNVTNKLSNEQIAARVAAALSKAERLGLVAVSSPTVVDAEFAPVGQALTASTVGESGDEDPSAGTTDNSDLV